MCGEGFLLGGESCFGGYPNVCGFYSIFGCLLDGYYTVYNFMYPPPSPLNFPQRYDFKGLTPNNHMDMDLSPFFGLNSRFGAVLGRISCVSALEFAHVPSTAWFIKEYWATPSRICLKTALRLCRSFAHQRPSSHWASCASVRGVTVDCDEESVGDKESDACSR